MKAFRKNLESYSENTRSIYDKRRKISKAVFSYIAENGDEYRKAFTDKPFKPESDFFKIAPLEIIVNG